MRGGTGNCLDTRSPSTVLAHVNGPDDGTPHKDTRAQGPRYDRVAYLMVLAVIVVLLPSIPMRGLWWDEAVYSMNALALLDDGELYEAFRPPVLHTLLAVTSAITGVHPLWTGRSTSVLALLVTLLLTYSITLRRHGQLPALMAMSILLGSWASISMAGLALSDSLSLFLATVGVLCLLRQWWRLYGLVCALSLFTRYTNGIMLIVIPLLMLRRRWSEAKLVAIVFALACLPWLGGNLLATGDPVHPMYLNYIVDRGFPASAPTYYLEHILELFVPVTFPLFLLGIAAYRKDRQDALPFMVALAFIVFHMIHPHKDMRYLFPVMPIYTLACGTGLVHLRWKERSRKMVALAIVALHIASMAAVIVVLRSDTGLQDMLAITHWIDEQSPHDILVSNLEPILTFLIDRPVHGHYEVFEGIPNECLRSADIGVFDPRLLGYDELKSVLPPSRTVLSRGQFIVNRSLNPHARAPTLALTFTDIGTDDIPFMLTLARSLSVVGLTATFFITPGETGIPPIYHEALASLQEAGMEFGLSGLTHLNPRYGGRYAWNEFYDLSEDEVLERLERGTALLESAGLQVFGTRSPELQSNAAVRAAEVRAGFTYGSTYLVEECPLPFQRTDGLVEVSVAPHDHLQGYRMMGPEEQGRARRAFLENVQATLRQRGTYVANLHLYSFDADHLPIEVLIEAGAMARSLGGEVSTLQRIVQDYQERVQARTNVRRPVS